MHSKKIEFIIIIGLLTIFCIPSSFGWYRDNASTTNSFSTAAWDVSINPGGNSSIRVIPNLETSQYSFTVTSDSEVDTTYSIIVSNIPSGVEVKLDNRTFQSGSTVTIPNAGTILYGESNENSHTLTFRATSGATIVNNQTINVSAEFSQIM